MDGPRLLMLHQGAITVLLISGVSEISLFEDGSYELLSLKFFWLFSLMYTVAAKAELKVEVNI